MINFPLIARTYADNVVGVQCILWQRKISLKFFQKPEKGNLRNRKQPHNDHIRFCENPRDLRDNQLL
jgi:hypothetical protein